jgi:cytochrome b subunit of formate dehydrogenase
MIDGTVTDDWARTHHPAWFSRHKEAQKAQKEE